MRKWIIIRRSCHRGGHAVYFALNAQGGVSGILNRGEAGATPTPLPVVEASPEVTVDAVVVPVRYADLSLRASGTVAEVFVHEGDAVEAGQLLARLDNDRQAIAIAQAEAQVSSAQARVAELKAGARAEEIAAVEAAVDLARANLAKLIEGSRPEDVSAAQAAFAAAEANLQELLKAQDDMPSSSRHWRTCRMPKPFSARAQSCRMNLVKWNPAWAPYLRQRS